LLIDQCALGRRTRCFLATELNDCSRWSCTGNRSRRRALSSTLTQFRK
jgi:hypothetical protein